MKFMKSLKMVLLGVAMAAATLSSVEPASALGGCGANRHRNAWGRCVWGGQNEDWCLQKDGPSRHLRGPWNMALLQVMSEFAQPLQISPRLCAGLFFAP